MSAQWFNAFDSQFDRFYNMLEDKKWVKSRGIDAFKALDLIRFGL